MMVTRRISLCNATREEDEEDEEDEEQEEGEEARPRYPVDGIQWAGAAAAYASLTISYGAA